MHIDQSNINNLHSELSKLNRDTNITTVTIGQLHLGQLQTLFKGLNKIAHVRKLIFAENCINNENIETIEYFIKNHKMNYEILYTNSFQRIFLLPFIYVMQLETIIEDIPSGFLISTFYNDPIKSQDDEQKSTRPPKQQNDLTNPMPAITLSRLANPIGQPASYSILKRRQNTEQSLPEPKTSQKKVRFLHEDETPTHEEDVRAYHNKLAHNQCGSLCEFHKAICSGQDDDMKQFIEKMPPTNKHTLLTTYCCEEEFLGASILRLALRTDHIILIDSLLNSGVNPLLCSKDGNTLLHDIVLELKPFALMILLKHFHTYNEITQYFNRPFCGGIYNGYFALDIICVEASLQFEDYDETKELSKRGIAHDIFSIINILLQNHAQSKLLLEQSKNLYEYIKPNKKGKYSAIRIWELIALIAENHELQQPMENTQPPQTNNLFTIKMLADQWQRNGILPRSLTTSPIMSPAAPASAIDRWSFK